MYSPRIIYDFYHQIEGPRRFDNIASPNTPYFEVFPLKLNITLYVFTYEALLNSKDYQGIKVLKSSHFI